MSHPSLLPDRCSPGLSTLRSCPLLRRWFTSVLAGARYHICRAAATLPSPPPPPPPSAKCSSDALPTSVDHHHPLRLCPASGSAHPQVPCAAVGVPGGETRAFVFVCVCVCVSLRVNFDVSAFLASCFRSSEGRRTYRTERKTLLLPRMCVGLTQSHDSCAAPLHPPPPARYCVRPSSHRAHLGLLFDFSCVVSSLLAALGSSAVPPPPLFLSFFLSFLLFSFPLSTSSTMLILQRGAQTPSRCAASEPTKNARTHAQQQKKRIQSRCAVVWIVSLLFPLYPF